MSLSYSLRVFFWAAISLHLQALLGFCWSFYIENTPARMAMNAIGAALFAGISYFGYIVLMGRQDINPKMGKLWLILHVPAYICANFYFHYWLHSSADIVQIEGKQLASTNAPFMQLKGVHFNEKQALDTVYSHRTSGKTTSYIPVFFRLQPLYADENPATPIAFVAYHRHDAYRCLSLNEKHTFVPMQENEYTKISPQLARILCFRLGLSVENMPPILEIVDTAATAAHHEQGALICYLILWGGLLFIPFFPQE